MSRFLAVEKISVVELDLLYTVESPHKIKMPVSAAELAVSYSVKTCSLLLCYELCYFFIFYSLELFCSYLTCLELLARILYLRRAGVSVEVLRGAGRKPHF